MLDQSTIITCPNCGRRNRVGPSAAGALKIVKLNVDDAPAISERYTVRSIPLLVMFRDGAEVDRLVGAAPYQRLREWVQPHLAPAAERT